MINKNFVIYKAVNSYNVTVILKRKGKKNCKMKICNGGLFDVKKHVWKLVVILCAANIVDLFECGHTLFVRFWFLFTKNSKFVWVYYCYRANIVGNLVQQCRYSFVCRTLVLSSNTLDRPFALYEYACYIYAVRTQSDHIDWFQFTWFCVYASVEVCSQ